MIQSREKFRSCSLGDNYSDLVTVELESGVVKLASPCSLFILFLFPKVPFHMDITEKPPLGAVRA